MTDKSLYNWLKAKFKEPEAANAIENTMQTKQPKHSPIQALVALIFTAISLNGCAVNTDPAIAYGNQLGAVEYTVKTGDNLVLIASEVTRQRENWRRIADFNQISNPASIRVGQKIWIPNDLLPLTANPDGSRPVAGHPDAVVNSVNLPSSIKPIN